MSKIVVAIDGFSACGKSTLAKALAARMGYVYVDSGAMYRAVTLYCMRKKIIDADGKFFKTKVVAALKKIKLSFKYNPSAKASDTYLNRVNVEKNIRQMDVSRLVSTISMVKEVRKHVGDIQKNMGKGKGIVMDGRDIGTNVFPDAELKIFMTADVDVRVQRRVDESNSKGEHVTFDEVKLNLMKRDYDDTHRKESPLSKAKDAIVLDNTDLSKEQQLEFVLKLIEDMLLTRDSLVNSN
jgi:cytidylate kinase